MPTVYSKQLASYVVEPALPLPPTAEPEGREKSPVDREAISTVSRRMEHGAPSPDRLVPPKDKSSLKALDLILGNVRSHFSGDAKTLPVVKTSLAAIRSWLELYYLYGFDFCRFPLATLVRAVSVVMEDVLCAYQTGSSWIDYFKYKNSAFFSAWNGQPLPEEPTWLSSLSRRNPKYLFPGAFYSFTQRKMSDPSFKQSFSLSVLMSKKGMPRPSEEEVTKATKKSVETMTTPKEQFSAQVTFEGSRRQYWWYDSRADPVPRTWSNVSSFQVVSANERLLRSEIRRTTRDLFRDFRLDLDVLSHFLIPSSSANYNFSRSKIGTWSSLLEVLKNYPEAQDLCKVDLMFRNNMIKLQGAITELYGPDGIFDQEVLDSFDTSREVIGLEIDCSNFLQKWRRFYWYCVNFALEHESEARCQAVGLSEALKVRVISKGPPITYFVLKPFQKAIWSHLRRFPCFKLIGEPVTEDLINDFLQEHWKEGSRFHSGDYKSATDELMSWASEEAVNSFFDCLDENMGYDHTPFRLLSLRAMVGHTYEYDDQLLPQRRGQLMGSIISFVFLCVINLSLLRLAYEFSHCVRVPVWKLPILVNGDDCLTIYTAVSFPNCWRVFGRVVGFIESIGKTYDSENFCSVNSRFYDLKDGRLIERLFYNLGLINCLKRSNVGGSQDTKLPHELGAVHRELLMLAPSKERAHRLFLWKNLNIIKQYQGPWFLPEYLGGLGLQNLNRSWSSEDLRYVTAARILINKGEQPEKYPSQSDWKLYDFFRRWVRIRCPLISSYFFKTYEGEEDYGTAFKAVVLHEFFSSRGVDKLHHKETRKEDFLLYEDLSTRSYKKRYTFFRKAQEISYSCLPADERTIAYEPKRQIFPVRTCTLG